MKVVITAKAELKQDWSVDDDSDINEVIQSCLDEIKDTCSKIGLKPDSYKIETKPE